jgi:hypothetical protein
MAEAESGARAHERFLIFQEPLSYFHHYRDIPVSEARVVPCRIWRDVKLVNRRGKHSADTHARQRLSSRAEILVPSMEPPRMLPFFSSRAKTPSLFQFAVR